MTRLPILTWGDARLRQVARPVGDITDAVRRLADDMTETMYDAPGRGLAAPQVGVGLRMFVIDAHWKDGAPRAPLVMIDPDIAWRSADTATHEEGCLSIPGVPAPITRPAAVTLRWTGLDGTARERRLEGTEAVCAQHEYDHLDGVLITDRMAPDLLAAAQAALDDLARAGGTA